MRVIERVCVFCGSNLGNDPAYAAAAREIGRLVAERGWGLVYGGGRVGLMGQVADAALAAGGEVVGSIPELLAVRELLHEGVTRMHVVPSMHARKALMAENSHAFIALPGGYGTFEELLEIITWAQLGLHGRPTALLNINGFFDPLIAFFDQAIAAGFIRPEQRALWFVETDPARLLDRLPVHAMPVVKKWITVKES